MTANRFWDFIQQYCGLLLLCCNKMSQCNFLTDVNIKKMEIHSGWCRWRVGHLYHWINWKNYDRNIQQSLVCCDALTCFSQLANRLQNFYSFIWKHYIILNVIFSRFWIYTFNTKDQRDCYNNFIQHNHNNFIQHNHFISTESTLWKNIK